MSTPIHRDPLAAWQHLRDLGGIELDGRDEGLDQRIHNNLNPGADSLDAALAQANMDDFARAFFASLHPYVEMFRGILDFFENSDATQGEAQWTLQLDGFDLDLEHFRQWLGTWDSLGKADITVPAIDSKSVWSICQVLGDRQPVDVEMRRSFNDDPLNVAGDVRAWVSAYNGDEYQPLPNSLVPPQCPPELAETASIARAALQRMLDLGLTPSTRYDLYKDKRIPGDPSDALDFWTIAQNETDLWLRTFITALSAAATLLSKSDLTSLSNDLIRITNKFPVRPFQVNVSISDLESVLSLPIWKKRYDLYSVWIATEIVRSLDGHDIEIHHDGGRIAFAFKETLVATVHTSPGPFRLISERRVPLKDPRGEGRKGAVQPDHGLWTLVDNDDVCKMAIEVKHYKKSAKAKFVDVFEDYARALPAGEIYLVNHGPTGKAVYEVSRTVRDRCFAIEHLTTSHSAAREEFANAVRGCVGEPLQSWLDPSATTDGDTVLLFDVSGSMTSTMRSEAMNTFVRDIAATDLPAKLVAVDRSIVGSWDTSEAGFASLLSVDGGSTNLSPAVAELLESCDSVVVVTDNDGLGTVNGVQIALHDLQDAAPPGIVVRVCKKL